MRARVMADDPNSTKPRLPDRACAESTSQAPRLAPTDPMWPEDPHGLTFLARFVNQTGFRVFAASWTGTEAEVEEFYLLPKLAEATMRHRRRADDLLSMHRPDLERLGDVAFARFQDNPEHWLIAQQLAKREYQEAWPASSEGLRFVRTTIIQWSRAGGLSLEICHVLGGPSGEFQPEWWDRPAPESLFYRCTIDPDDPFGRRPNRKTDNDHYIYAPVEAHDQIVIASPNDPETEPKLSHTGSVDLPKLLVAKSEAAEAAQEKHPGGAPTEWDWAGIITLLKQRKDGKGRFKNMTTFKNATAFKQFIQKHVQRVDGSDRGDGPDPSTVNRAISTHKLKRFAAFEE